MNNQRSAYSEIMPIDGEGEDIAHGLVDDTEAVRETGSNSGDCPRDLGPTVVTAHAVDSSGIGDTLRNMSGSVKGGVNWLLRDNASGDVVFKQVHTGIVPVITELNDLKPGRSSIQRSSDKIVEYKPLTHRQHHTGRPLGRPGL